MSACGRGAAENATEGSATPGVTDRAITLGVLSDLSGPFGALGTPITAGQRLYWERRNAAGGVCGRRVELVVKDHGYDTQRAVAAYREIAPRVAALQQLLGSPVAAALLASLERDDMYAALAGAPSSLLTHPNLQITGATYDLEMINGIDFLLERALLSPGVKVGHIYIEGDFGESALQGSRHAAAEHGLTLIEHEVKPTDVDMSAQISALRRERVDAILLSTSPPQTASAAGVARSVGLDVPFLANAPGFVPQLLGGPVARALERKLYVAAPIAPPSFEAEGIRAVVRAWREEHGQPPSAVAIGFGWATAAVMDATLKQACRSGDLSRSGILAALRKIQRLDTKGLVAGPLSYSEVGEPPTRAVYITRPSRAAVGGLVVAGDGPYESTTARAYTGSR